MRCQTDARKYDRGEKKEKGAFAEGKKKPEREGGKRGKHGEGVAQRCGEEKKKGNQQRKKGERDESRLARRGYGGRPKRTGEQGKKQKVKRMSFVNCSAEAITKLYFYVCVDHTLNPLSIHDRLGIFLAKFFEFRSDSIHLYIYMCVCLYLYIFHPSIYIYMCVYIYIYCTKVNVSGPLQRCTQTHTAHIISLCMYVYMHILTLSNKKYICIYIYILYIDVFAIGYRTT